MKKQQNEIFEKPNDSLWEITYTISKYFQKKYPNRLDKIEDILTKVSSKLWSNNKKIKFLKDKFDYVFSNQIKESKCNCKKHKI